MPRRRLIQSRPHWARRPSRPVVDSTDWGALSRVCAELGAFLSAGLPASLAIEAVENRVGMDAFTEGAGRHFLISWRVCNDLGAPLASVCSAFGEACEAFAHIQRDVVVAVAGPRFASRIMLTLPAVGLVLGAALGLNAMSFLLTTVLGWLCLVFAGACVTVALWWSRRLIAAVHVRDIPLGVLALVTSCALRAGIGMRTAANRLNAECDVAGLPRYPSIAAGELRLAQEWGIPLADVLLISARLDRDRAISEVRARANELAERLLVPLGACVLPAFIALSVVPIVVQLIGSAGLMWA